MRKYPLGCTIPCTNYILLFFLTKKLVILRKKTTYAKSVMNLVTNTLIVVTIATSTFTSNVLFCNFEDEFHDHPLTPIGKTITFTCDIYGKESKGVPHLCAACCFWIHRSCASFPRRLKVVHHKHPFHITHSSLELHESDSRFSLLYVQKVDTHYSLYYCSKMCKKVTMSPPQCDLVVGIFILLHMMFGKN